MHPEILLCLKLQFERMRSFITVLALILAWGCIAQPMPPMDNLKIVIIRHGEKPEKGGNLTCRGLNRSLQLPKVIAAKFGVPDYTYVPTIKMADKTSHARMFETVIPMAVKYNLTINSAFDEKDVAGLAIDLRKKKGTVLVVWEHSGIASLAHELGVADQLTWPSDDFDSIWIINYNNGKLTFLKDKEDLTLSDDCP
jgi:hypothetical protein